MPPQLSSKLPDSAADRPVLVASVNLAFEQDIVLARQRARLVAERLGFDVQNQVRIATAVSEIAREGLQSGAFAAIEFAVDGRFQRLLIRLQLGPACSRIHSTRSALPKELLPPAAFWVTLWSRSRATRVWVYSSKHYRRGPASLDTCKQFAMPSATPRLVVCIRNSRPRIKSCSTP